MTRRAKRLTLMLGVAALVAVVVASLIAPEPAAAARQFRDPNAFVIKAALEHDMFARIGTFEASGAIEDWGTAVHYYGSYRLQLYGQFGYISIDLFDPYWPEFTAITEECTDTYAGLTASGTWSQKTRNAKQPWQTTTYSYTLKGTVDQ